MLRYSTHLRVVAARESTDVVVKLKTSGPAREALRSLAAAPAARRRDTSDRGPLRQILAGSLLRSLEPLFPGSTGRRAAASERLVLSVEQEKDSKLAGFNVMHFGSAQDAEAACKLLGQDPSVEYAHPIRERFLFEPARAARRRAAQAVDPLRNRQWGLRAIELVQAQNSSGFKEATDVVIAVIDTGVDSSHPDLAGVLVEELNFTSGPRRDTKGHGTHVIGIIAAVRDNKVGISGVCQSRKIMSLKALGPYSGPGYYRAIRHATDNGAKVINLSLGGEQDPTEEMLIRRALNRGVVVVAAMGNEFDEGNPTSYPAAIRGVVAVGATTETDGRAPFSNTGPHIDLAAPGVNILSTVPTYPAELAEITDYEAWPGTSMATPFVAATAALLLAKKPSASVAQISRVLRDSADKAPGQTGFSRELGAGRLNVRRALAAI